MPDIGLGASVIKVNNTDAMPMSMRLQIAYHFPTHYLHIKLRRQERPSPLFPYFR